MGEVPHLGGHDQLVVDDVVRRVAHPEQGAGGVQVTRHARPHVHVLADALRGWGGGGGGDEKS